jgi:hypothetical protein
MLAFLKLLHQNLQQVEVMDVNRLCHLHLLQYLLFHPLPQYFLQRLHYHLRELLWMEYQHLVLHHHLQHDQQQMQ